MHEMLTAAEEKAIKIDGNQKLWKKLMLMFPFGTVAAISKSHNEKCCTRCAHMNTSEAELLV